MGVQCPAQHLLHIPHLLDKLGMACMLRTRVILMIMDVHSKSEEYSAGNGEKLEQVWRCQGAQCTGHAVHAGKVGTFWKSRSIAKWIGKMARRRRKVVQKVECDLIPSGVQIAIADRLQVVDE
jgi:hypothetical protein